jgi:hypothetical protein
MVGLIQLLKGTGKEKEIFVGLMKYFLMNGLGIVGELVL